MPEYGFSLTRIFHYKDRSVEKEKFRILSYFTQWSCMRVFQIMRVTKSCVINTYCLTFSIINVNYQRKMNGSLFSFALTFGGSFVRMPHSVLLSEMNHVSSFIIC